MFRLNVTIISSLCFESNTSNNFSRENLAPFALTLDYSTNYGLFAMTLSFATTFGPYATTLKYSASFVSSAIRSKYAADNPFSAAFHCSHHSRPLGSPTNITAPLLSRAGAIVTLPFCFCCGHRRKILSPGAAPYRLFTPTPLISASHRAACC